VNAPVQSASPESPPAASSAVAFASPAHGLSGQWAILVGARVWAGGRHGLCGQRWPGEPRVKAGRAGVAGRPSIELGFSFLFFWYYFHIFDVIL
jgi:hypothetical protein